MEGREGNTEGLKDGETERHTKWEKERMLQGQICLYKKPCFSPMWLAVMNQFQCVNPLCEQRKRPSCMPVRQTPSLCHTDILWFIMSIITHTSAFKVSLAVKNRNFCEAKVKFYGCFSKTTLESCDSCLYKRYINYVNINLTHATASSCPSPPASWYKMILALTLQALLLPQSGAFWENGVI